MKPTAFSIARAPARSTPSVSAALRRLAGSVGCVVDAHAGVGSLVGDAQGQDARVGKTRFERGGDGCRVGLRGPDDDGRARSPRA